MSAGHTGPPALRPAPSLFQTVRAGAVALAIAVALVVLLPVLSRFLPFEAPFDTPTVQAARREGRREVIRRLFAANTFLLRAPALLRSIRLAAIGRVTMDGVAPPSGQEIFSGVTPEEGGFFMHEYPITHGFESLAKLSVVLPNYLPTSIPLPTQSSDRVIDLGEVSLQSLPPQAVGWITGRVLGKQGDVVVVGRARIPEPVDPHWCAKKFKVPPGFEIECSPASSAARGGYSSWGDGPQPHRRFSPGQGFVFEIGADGTFRAGPFPEGAYDVQVPAFESTPTLHVLLLTAQTVRLKGGSVFDLGTMVPPPAIVQGYRSDWTHR